jgi:hypothetical protein
VNSTNSEILRQVAAKSLSSFWPYTCAYYYGAGAPADFRTLASSRNSFGWPRKLVGSRLTVRIKFPASLLARWIDWSSGFPQMLTSNVTVLAFLGRAHWLAPISASEPASRRVSRRHSRTALDSLPVGRRESSSVRQRMDYLLETSRPTGRTATASRPDRQHADSYPRTI